jgi:hypothetical protein
MSFQSASDATIASMPALEKSFDRQLSHRQTLGSGPYLGIYRWSLCLADPSPSCPHSPEANLPLSIVICLSGGWISRLMYSENGPCGATTAKQWQIVDKGAPSKIALGPVP